MSVKRMEVTSFVDVSGERKQDAKMSANVLEKKPVRARSMLIKVGACAIACLITVVVKYTVLDEEPQKERTVMAGQNEDAQPRKNLAQILGRLELVSLADVAQVFSEELHPTLPITGTPLRMDDGFVLKWNCQEKTDVAAAMGGTVYDVGRDDKAGNYVVLLHEDDVQTYYFGIDEVCVEKGQPIRVKDTIGSIGKNGTLKFEIKQKGTPQDPQQYFDF